MGKKRLRHNEKETGKQKMRAHENLLRDSPAYTVEAKCYRLYHCAPLVELL